LQKEAGKYERYTLGEMESDDKPGAAPSKNFLHKSLRNVLGFNRCCRI
jgi:hypothetical protein